MTGPEPVPFRLCPPHPRCGPPSAALPSAFDPSAFGPPPAFALAAFGPLPVPSRPSPVVQVPEPRWPLRSVMPEMGALMTAPRAARAHVRGVLAQWGLSRLADDAEAAAGELAGNVVRLCHDQDGRPAYPGGVLPVLRLSLLCDWQELMIAVFDPLPGVPAEQPPSDDRESGRGLAMLAKLGRWDWVPVPGGKLVRAWLPVKEAA
jgi:hypothetical protein